MLTLNVVVTPATIELLELLWARLLTTEELATLEDAGIEPGATDEAGAELGATEATGVELGATELAAMELGATLLGAKAFLLPPPPPQATRLITIAANKLGGKHAFIYIEVP